MNFHGNTIYYARTTAEAVRALIIVRCRNAYTGKRADRVVFPDGHTVIVELIK